MIRENCKIFKAYTKNPDAQDSGYRCLKCACKELKHDRCQSDDHSKCPKSLSIRLFAEVRKLHDVSRIVILSCFSGKKA